MLTLLEQSQQDLEMKFRCSDLGLLCLHEHDWIIFLHGCNLHSGVITPECFVFWWFSKGELREIDIKKQKQVSLCMVLETFAATLDSGTFDSGAGHLFFMFFCSTAWCGKWKPCMVPKSQYSGVFLIKTVMRIDNTWFISPQPQE